MRVFLTFFTLLFGLFFSTHQALAQQSPTYCTPHSDCELVYGHTTGAIPAQLSIVRVEFNGQFTNYSNWQRCCCINNGYQDFTEVEGIVEQAGTYDIKVIAQPYSNEWSATGYTCQIWVDWNRNYEFEDTELTIIPGDQVAAFETFTLTFPGQIVVPHNAFTGETRMRIRVHHSNNFPKSLKGDLEAADSLLGNPGIPGEPYGNKWLDAVPDTMPGPCDSSRTGETEDYTLLVYSEAPPRTGYCTASGPENCRGSRLDLDGTGLPTKYEFVHIDTVRIEGANGTSIDNPSSLQECQADGSYSDYTREFQYPPSWTIDSAYQIYVSRVDVLDTLGSWCGIFIDWNSDFDFDDPGETYLDYLNPEVTGPRNDHTFSITPPIDAAIGRKRVRIRTTQAQATPDACGERYNTGEVEDYEIFLSDTGELAPYLDCVVDSTATPQNTNEICQQDPQFRWNISGVGDQPTGFYFSLGTDNPPSNIIDKLDVGPNLGYDYMGKLQANTKYFWTVTPYNANGEANLPCKVYTFNTAKRPDPIPDIVGSLIINDTAVVCPNVTVKMRAGVSGGNGQLTYQWFGDGAYVVAGGPPTDSLHYRSNIQHEGKYFVTITDGFGCEGDDSVVVRTKTPARSGELNGLETVCREGDVDLFLSNSLGDIQWQKLDSYLNVWNNVDGENDTNIRFTDIKFANTYRAIANFEGCTDTLDPFVVDNFPTPPAPSVTSSVGENLCDGDSSVLESSFNGLNIWSTKDSTQSITVNTHGEYQVYYFASNGCPSDTASFQLISFPYPAKPGIDNGERGFCIGDSLLLTSSSNNANLFWNDNKSVRGNELIVKAPGKYWISASNIAGCTTTSDTVEIEEYPLPQKVNIASSNGFFEFCEGESLQLEVNTTANVFWLNSSLITGQNFSTNRPGEVFAKLVSSKGCVNYTDTVEIEVNPKPEKPLVITVDGKTEYCYDEQAILLVTGNFLPLQWNTIPPSVNDSIWPTESGTYIATVSNNFGCTNNSEPIEIIYRDSLEIPTIYNEKDTLIVDLDESHVFQWYGDGFRLLGQNNNFMVADADGIYQVEVTDAFGCTNISAPFNFNYAQATTGIQEFSNAGINLFPNPVKVGDVLKFRGVKEAATAVFYDGLGKEVLRTNEILEISTSVLSSGVYTVTLQTKSKILVGKLMVE